MTTTHTDASTFDRVTTDFGYEADFDVQYGAPLSNFGHAITVELRVPRVRLTKTVNPQSDFDAGLYVRSNKRPATPNPAA